jgi:regulator of protease activity HflC (stomatin/prohibitin superfamily)
VYNMYKEIQEKDDKDFDPKIISWDRTSKGIETPLMYIYPQAGDNFKEKKAFSVKDYEKALFYSKGKLVGVLGGGIYEIDKKAKIKGTEIVWIDISIIEVPWGIPQSSGIPTKDGRVIGLHGDLKLKINDVKTFYSEIVAGKKTWNVKDLRGWLMSLFHTSMRDIFKRYEAKCIILEDRERIINLITSKVTEELLRYGLELDSLNIIGIQAPEGVENLYKIERETSKVGEELELLKLKGQLESKQFEHESAKRPLEPQQLEIVAKKEDEKGNIEKQIAELKEKMIHFDELLFENKISEDTYKTRIEIFSQELKDLQQRLEKDR